MSFFKEETLTSRLQGFVICKMTDGGEDPGTRCKILEESWSILSRDTLRHGPSWFVLKHYTFKYGCRMDSIFDLGKILVDHFAVRRRQLI